jgi:hypothetical protein
LDGNLEGQCGIDLLLRCRSLGKAKNYPRLKSGLWS